LHEIVLSERKQAMDTDNASQERRREYRQKVKITVLLKMGVLLNGRGIARDISLHGMCLVSPQIFKAISTVQQKEFIGAPLRVMIPTEALTVNGILAWVDLKKGEGAISITSTSDDDKWNEFIKNHKL
jgi:hypothetical protein